ncbi:MAG TPA: GNAT family N-acetyltransferase [Candidatus Eisenbergiella merdavium]|uniref:GNAT family N-acetyltransferase n=1 Tax=Candidatus Eisenbergiella merdavium TaxID=2838551 RepID=A0A9D2SQL1_9FIRM|nr:GNAT family N-acetyltransferase [Candidatus Eisenbergiella merdavium]
MVLFGTKKDIDAWMALVNLVSWNFPGLETTEKLEEHERIVLQFMEEKRALCVKDVKNIKDVKDVKDIKDNEKIIGVLLFSTKHNMICCLAVHPDYRNRGVGSALLKEALGKLDRSKRIVVSTFREEDEKGKAPRALYKKFGFVEDELIEEFGYPNQRFILYP